MFAALMMIGFFAWIGANVAGIIFLIHGFIKKQPKKKAVKAFGVGLIAFVLMIVGAMNMDTSYIDADTSSSTDPKSIDEQVASSDETDSASFETTTEGTISTPITTAQDIDSEDASDEDTAETSEKTASDEEISSDETSEIADKSTAKDEPENDVEKTDEKTIEKEKGIRDETLNGHGRSDSGRSEPQYVGIIGYAVSDYKYSSDDDALEPPWSVSIYEKDKQFYNEVGTIEHKTEVVVLSQELHHEGFGNYSGYLTVEDTKTSEEYILDVSNFITKPYWTYDIYEAAKVGDCIAEFNQVSDYYPVDRDNEKVVLDDGFSVLVTGTTGTYGKGGPDKSTNQIEAIVFKEWTYGYGGVSVFFNAEDLTLTY